MARAAEKPGFESKPKANRGGNPNWAPGRSGNPGGRLKKSPELRRIEDLAREHSDEAILALVDEAKNGKGAPRVSAATAILDRGWGKPIERQESGEPGAFSDSIEDIEARVRERSVRLGLAKVIPLKAAG